MITITAVEAQNRFGQLLDTAQREPITITRHGRPIAMLMAVEEFQARQQPDGAAAARAAVAAFRGAGKGKGGTVEQLFADRRADIAHEQAREPVAPYVVKAVKAVKVRAPPRESKAPASAKTKANANAKKGRS